MCFFDVIRQRAIFIEDSSDLLGEFLEVGRPWIHRGQLGQSLVNGFQLLVTCQTTPGKRLACAAIDRIADRQAELCFNFETFSITS
jgi:hypothetical protein